MESVKKTYSMRGGPKGSPVLGSMPAIKRDPIAFLMENALHYGDIIPFTVLGKQTVQVNHPDLVRYILMENHKNYQKSKSYIRFESALGKGLLTSNGEKWLRDRKKIQPMFKREQVEGYYFDIASEVGEKYKRRWLSLTEHGSARLNITHEMADITIEIIVKMIFGKDNLDDETVASLHHSYSVFIEYLRGMRLLPPVDLRQLLRHPAYAGFKKELDSVEAILKRLLERYRQDASADKYNMLALLIEAQKEDPAHFSEQDIRDHSVSMVFAGFESTSILMQWMWYVLDARPDVTEKLRADIAGHAPCTMQFDSTGLTYGEVAAMDYLSAVFKETLRLYPPFWTISRSPVEDDRLGDFSVPRGTVVVLPQIVMHRHPCWWEQPNAFVPERFLGGLEASIDDGLYFPFAQGGRKCTASKLVEMEAKTIFAKLLPLFSVTALNAVGNRFDPSISLKMKQPLHVQIKRI